MSTTENTVPAVSVVNADLAGEDSPNDRIVQKELNGRWFKAHLYPGWVSAVDVNGVPLYDQVIDKPFPFKVPGGGDPQRGGPFRFNRDSRPNTTWMLDVSDPKQEIEAIVVYLRPEGSTGPAGQSLSSAGWSVVVNDPHAQIRGIVVYQKDGAVVGSGATAKADAEGTLSVDGSVSADGALDDTGDTITVYNTAVACPPQCNASPSNVKPRTPRL